MTPQYLLAPAASVFGKDGDIKYKYMYTYTQFPPSTVLPAHNSAPQQKQPCFTNTTRTWHCPGKEAKKHLQTLKKKYFTQNLYRACQLLQMIFQWCLRGWPTTLSKLCKSIKYCSDTESWIIQCSKSRTVDFSQRQQSGSKYITVSWQTTDCYH